MNNELYGFKIERVGREHFYIPKNTPICPWFGNFSKYIEAQKEISVRMPFTEDDYFNSCVSRLTTIPLKDVISTTIDWYFQVEYLIFPPALGKVTPGLFPIAFIPLRGKRQTAASGFFVNISHIHSFNV